MLWIGTVIAVYALWKVSMFVSKHPEIIRKPFRKLIPRSFPRVPRIFFRLRVETPKKRYKRRLKQLTKLPINEDELAVLQEEFRREYIEDSVR